jgi:hypothetical protein
MKKSSSRSGATVKKENDLEFPVISQEPLGPSVRTVDEINEWIEQDYPLFFDRAVYEAEKKMNSVDSPFVLDA